ncbi:MAG: hypothetical protein WCF18_07605 [Chthoniobacteraceae bacterium]
MKFEPNRPIETSQAAAQVDAGLPVGRHRFQLIVVNSRGQSSKPSEAVVIVLDPGQPPPPTR